MGHTVDFWGFVVRVSPLFSFSFFFPLSRFPLLSFPFSLFFSSGALIYIHSYIYTYTYTYIRTLNTRPAVDSFFILFLPLSSFSLLLVLWFLLFSLSCKFSLCNERFFLRLSLYHCFPTPTRASRKRKKKEGRNDNYLMVT